MKVISGRCGNQGGGDQGGGDCHRTYPGAPEAGADVVKTLLCRLLGRLERADVFQLGLDCGQLLRQDDLDTAERTRMISIQLKGQG